MKPRAFINNDAVERVVGFGKPCKGGGPDACDAVFRRSDGCSAILVISNDVESAPRPASSDEQSIGTRRPGFAKRIVPFVSFIESKGGIAGEIKAWWSGGRAVQFEIEEILFVAKGVQIDAEKLRR